MCGYEQCAPPEYNDRHLLTCINGAWALTESTACPPLPCPPTPPVLGSVCEEHVTPELCTYADACGGAFEVACVEGNWQAAGGEERDVPAAPDPPAPMCPPYPPYLGDPCCPASVPETCDYSATATGTDGAAGASFLINPVGSTSGGGAEPPLTLTCAVCTPQMTWGYCNLE